jgi:DNA replication protein DnaC
MKLNFSKERYLFPSGNTSKGFFSFYEYIISQEDANRIICLKGGPGTGKSFLMKKIGSYFSNIGYSLEYHHSSFDNESLDGLVIKELNIALLDGSSPHTVDPINPGAVDEILNVGIALDTISLIKNKKDIIKINKEIEKNFKRTYRFLRAAKEIHEDWSSTNYESLNSYDMNDFIKELKTAIITSTKPGYGKDRHMFSTAFTSNGIISFNKALSSQVEKLYVLKGGPGLGKTDVLKVIGADAQKNGYNVEYLHDPLIPERIENILIPELSTGIFTTNEISNVSYSGKTYNMIDLCYKSSLTSKLDEILFDKMEFNTLIEKSLSCIKNAKILRDELKSYYMNAMNYDIIDTLYYETLQKIKSYIIS